MELKRHGWRRRKKVLPGFEPGSENSKSSVITDYTIGPLTGFSSLWMLRHACHSEHRMGYSVWKREVQSFSNTMTCKIARMERNAVILFRTVIHSIDTLSTTHPMGWYGSSIHCLASSLWSPWQRKSQAGIRSIRF